VFFCDQNKGHAIEEPSSVFTEAFKQIPSYLTTFGSIISSPVSFIQNQIQDRTPDALPRAFSFASLSVLIALTALYLTLKMSISQILIAGGLISILEITFSYVAVSMICRLVCSEISSDMVLIAVLYLFGFAQFINALLWLLLSANEFGSMYLILGLIAQLCWILVPLRALALSAKLNYRRTAFLFVLVVPALLTARWLAFNIGFYLGKVS
jgi:hypothetical protein